MLLAVVLIIALVSIALLGFFPGTASDSQIAESQIYWKSANPLTVIETGNAYVRPNSGGWHSVILKIRNSGSFPIRLLNILGGGNNMSQYFECTNPPACGSGTYHSMSDIYLAPGEETCFGGQGVPGNYCVQHLIGIFPVNTSVPVANIAAADGVCDNQGNGVLSVKQFGFEYVVYIESATITKRQVGSKPLLFRCAGTF